MGWIKSLFAPKPFMHPWQLQDVLLKSRRNDKITEEVCKQLKCNPNEMIERITKSLQRVGEIKDYLNKEYVGMLIDRIHLDCKKHEGPSCRKCEKCLNNQCRKCEAVDWLRADLGLPRLLKEDTK